MRTPAGQWGYAGQYLSFNLLKRSGKWKIGIGVEMLRGFIRGGWGTFKSASCVLTSPCAMASGLVTITCGMPSGFCAAASLAAAALQLAVLVPVPQQQTEGGLLLLLLAVLVPVAVCVCVLTEADLRTEEVGRSDAVIAATGSLRT